VMKNWTSASRWASVPDLLQPAKKIGSENIL
jgi:hypothetical protein